MVPSATPSCRGWGGGGGWLGSQDARRAGGAVAEGTSYCTGRSSHLPALFDFNEASQALRRLREVRAALSSSSSSSSELFTSFCVKRLWKSPGTNCSLALDCQTCAPAHVFLRVYVCACVRAGGRSCVRARKYANIARCMREYVLAIASHAHTRALCVCMIAS